MRFNLLPVIVREILSKRTLPREPEPDLVMADADQVAAYAEAGRIDGVMAAAYLFHSAHITQVIHNCQRVIDLGCGPATQLAQVAMLNPQTHFLGIELSAGMLAQAKQHIANLGLHNVEFMQGDMTDLAQLTTASVDGVMSTMALHHLPTHAHLQRCFSEIKRVLKPQGALYLTDFGRLKSLYTVIYFAYMNREYQPHIFSLDYERSLRAAFLHQEFAQLSQEQFGNGYAVYATAPLPVLVLIKSADTQPLPITQQTALRSIRNHLHSRYQGDLNMIRTLFRLGGLKNDPFAA